MDKLVLILRKVGLYGFVVQPGADQVRLLNFDIALKSTTEATDLVQDIVCPLLSDVISLFKSNLHLEIYLLNL